VEERRLEGALRRWPGRGGVAAAQVRIRIVAVQHRERCSAGERQGGFWQTNNVVRNDEKILVKAPDPSLI
jgi:hypothetical protein